MCRSSSPVLLLRWLRRSVSRLSGGIRFVFGDVVDVVGAGVEEGILVEAGRSEGRLFCRWFEGLRFLMEIVSYR